MKTSPQSNPITNEEPMRLPIVEAYPDEIQPVNQEIKINKISANHNPAFNSYTKK